MAGFVADSCGGGEWPRWKISEKLATILETALPWARTTGDYPPVISTQALLLALATDPAAAMGPALEGSGLDVARLRLAVTGAP